MELKLLFNYDFHPVGQGLFASGELYLRPPPLPAFQWVYDCGSVSSQSLIDFGLQLMSLRGGRQPLDILTLSHFDKDHISGVSRLLQQTSVDMLLLPYLPLWKRLIIAFEEGVSPRSDAMRFYLNPAEYLTSLPQANIRRIIFVLPGGEDGPGLFDAGPARWDGPPEVGIDFGRNKPRDADESAEQGQLSALQGISRPTVEFMGPGGTIQVGSFWEFVPYNDDSPTALSNAFTEEARNLRDELRSPAEESLLQASLKKLKDHYDGIFKEGIQRNVISLFLYSGPVYGGNRLLRLRRFGSHDHSRAQYYPKKRGRNIPLSTTPAASPRIVVNWQQPGPTERCSVLYPGDGYLDTPARLDRMTNYLGQSRCDKVGVFQVMHHGAEGNWYSGVASRLAPTVSIFSSDPKRKPFHPHLPVLKDFHPFRPIQVDRQVGAYASGEIWI